METISFRCNGIVSHIVGPRYSRLSKLWFTFFTFVFGIVNCDLFLKSFWSDCFKGKRSFKISDERTGMGFLVMHFIHFD